MGEPLPRRAPGPVPAGLRLSFAALVLVAPLLSGCGDTPGPAGPEPAEATRDHVVIGVRADAGSFNIYTATNAFTQDVVDLLFLKLAEELADFGDGPPGFRPALARSWEFSDDGATLTFRLDPGARWSDGRAITADDVLLSHAAATSPEVGWVAADVKERITAVEAPDPRTVVFRFSRIYPYRLMDAVDGNVIPAHVWGFPPFADWPSTAFVDAPVASGPFLLSRYEPGALIELTHNPGYLRAPLPRLSRVVFRIIPDPATLLNELLAGGIDVMTNVSEDVAGTIEDAGHLRLVRAPDLSYGFICWNTARPPFDDERVRRAMTLAIDRQAILEGLMPRTGRLATSPIPSLLWAHDDSLAPLPYDPDGARRLLAEAGWRDGDGDGVLDRGGEPLRFELEANQESTLRGRIVEIVVEQLRRIGVDAVPRRFEFGTYIDRHERHDFDAFVGSWRESTKVDLKSVFHSDAIAQGYNYGGFRDRELDRLIDEARSEPDRDAARALWHEAQRILAEHQPYTLLYEQDRLHAVHRDLAGFAPTPRSAYADLESWDWSAAGGDRP